MQFWYSGLCFVFVLMLLVSCIYCEARKESASDAIVYVIVGKFAIFAIFWIVLAVVACIFIQVRTVLMYVDIGALIVLFVLYLKNTPERIRRRKMKFKSDIENIVNEVKDGFTKK